MFDHSLKLCFWKIKKKRLKEMKSEATNSFKVNVNSVLSWHLDRMEAISYIFKSFLCCSIQVHEVHHLGTGQLFAGDFMGRYMLSLSGTDRLFGMWV